MPLCNIVLAHESLSVVLGLSLLETVSGDLGLECWDLSTDLG